MSALSDILTVGLVLILLFGSVSLYLYTRIQQAEKKISLLESILLDIKMNSEMKDYGNLPAMNEDIQPAEYTPFNSEESDTEDVTLGTSGHPSSPVSTKSEYKTLDDVIEEVSQGESESEESNESKPEQVSSTPVQEKVSVNYESMSIKELHQLGKQRNIINGSTMKRKQLIEALKTSDRTLEQSGSFLETSTFLQGTDVSV